MLATPWNSPFADDQWIFELKWDGVRCLLSADGGEVRLHSRSGSEMTARYPEITAAAFPDGLVLDGEIVAFDEAGNPSFERLQGRMNVASGVPQIPVSLVVFDLLHSGESLVNLSLEERLARLDDLQLPHPCIFAGRFDGDPAQLWDFVVARSLEGMIAKRRGSAYQPGVRSPDWRKIANFAQVRAVVGGFTPGTGGRALTFGSLLLGLWAPDGLRWIGAVGSGFDDPALRAIRSALDDMTIADSPFREDTEIPQPATWVSPQLVAVVRFKQWTRAGRLRSPSFKGFTDYPPHSATWSSEGPAHAE
jgi:bifunctional non-homologous end joining protein LigD